MMDGILRKKRPSSKQTKNNLKDTRMVNSSNNRRIKRNLNLEKKLIDLLLTPCKGIRRNAIK